MARYYVGKDETAADVAADLIGQADDPRTVVYIHDGERGAFEIPDELADAYMTADARKAREERAAERAQAEEDALAAYRTPGPHDPTAADLAGADGNATLGTYEAVRSKTRRGRRSAAAQESAKE